MRILLLSNLFPPDTEGGAEVLAGGIAWQLQQMGHDVLVLTGSNGARASSLDGRVRRTLRFVPPAHVDRSYPLWRQFDQPYRYYQRYHCPSNAAELRRVVEHTQPDVLYIWEITGLGVTSLLTSLPQLRIPVVFHLGSYWLLYAREPETAQSRLRARWLKRSLIGNVPDLTWTSCIAVSGTVKQEYAQAGFDPDRIEVIYNGVDPRFQAVPLPDGPASNDAHRDRIELLFAGRVCAEKGIFTAVQALRLVANEHRTARGDAAPVHLHVIGDGDAASMRELRTFLREEGLTEMVTFHGSVPHDELVGHYDRADIMLVPSLWKEPFGLVVIEAMARGLPVIASRVGGPAEIITHGVNGLLIEPGDALGLAQAVRQLLDDPDQRSRLGIAARETVARRFTLAETATRVAEHLQRAARGVVCAQTPGSSSSANRGGLSHETLSAKHQAV